MSSAKPPVSGDLAECIGGGNKKMRALFGWQRDHNRFAKAKEHPAGEKCECYIVEQHQVMEKSCLAETPWAEFALGVDMIEY